MDEEEEEVNNGSWAGDVGIGLLGRASSSDGDCWTGVPLVGVSVEAETDDFIAEVKIIQCYKNTHSDSIQTKYIFPIDESAALCGFQAEYADGRIVKEIVKEKNQAKQEFREALRQGKQANLPQAVTRDTFSLQVGNLPPGANVKTTITYVTALTAREDAAAFILPTYVAPRYEWLSSDEAEAMECPRSHGIDVKIHFRCLSNITAIRCPTHEWEPSLSWSFEGKNGNLVLQAPMNRKLVALVSEEN